jgi:hypothetical protein
MKIRAGFVSNSSTTSFLIIAKDELNQADFFELMGVKPDSPIADLFAQLYRDLLERASIKVDFKSANKDVPVEAWFDRRSDRLSSLMIEKLREAKKRGLKAYFGALDSETSMIQTFFCTDSFEVENEKIYFNGLECVW